MKRTQLTLSALIAMLLTGNLVIMLNGEPTTVQVVSEPDKTWSELKDEPATAKLLAYVASAGVAGEFYCKVLTAENSNMPGKTLCFDGKSAAWIVPDQYAEKLAIIEGHQLSVVKNGGKIFTKYP